MPDRSKVMIQTKRNTLTLQVGVGRGVDGPTPLQALTAEKHLTIAAKRWREIVKEAKVHHGLYGPKKKKRRIDK
jgi:hypothetical protein